MIAKMVTDRKLPDLMVFQNGEAVKTPDDWRARRRELLDLLSREEYGFTPDAPKDVTGAVEKCENAFAGKAVQEEIKLTFQTPSGPFSFPCTLIIPKNVEKAPVFVSISFSAEVPNRYMPTEEIIDHGFAIAIFYYQNITSDNAEIDGLAACYPRDEKTGWGKLGMWAFAASRILDYLETRPEIDTARACITGHSRLGKAALWCGAQDERFSMVISNCSGCSGAAISRGKEGEKIDRIAAAFPFWFCGNYQNWRGREWEAPFDQHMLLSLIAPRLLYVNSAEEDTWADPESEFLGCAAASEAWTLLRVPGLVTPDEMPKLNEPLHTGSVCYHKRPGSHFYSRTDWLFQMECRDRHHV